MRRFLVFVILGILFLFAVGNYIFSDLQLQSSLSRCRERLMIIAANAALSIDVPTLQKVPLIQRGEATREYQTIAASLTAIKKINPILKYVYILTATDQPGILQYVVDADPLPEIVTAHCVTALPGDKFDARAMPELLSAYRGPTADLKVTTDVWGTSLSGYAPLRNDFGETVGILAVDTDASWVSARQKKAKFAGLAALGAGLIFLLSFLIFVTRRRITA